MNVESIYFGFTVKNDITVVRCHKGQGNWGQNGHFAKIFGRAIGDTGDYGRSFARGNRGHFFRILVFTNLHIKHMLLGHEVLIRNIFRGLVSPYLIQLT
jgi:hypothetical protein